MQLNDLRCLSRVYCLILASSVFWSVMVLNCIGQFIELEGDFVWFYIFRSIASQYIRWKSD